MYGRPNRRKKAMFFSNASGELWTGSHDIVIFFQGSMGAPGPPGSLGSKGREVGYYRLVSNISIITLAT